MTGSPANHEGSGRANIDGIIVFQLFGEKGWTKSLVPANVATSEENHQRHRLPFANSNAKVSDRSQTPLTLDSSLSDSAGSGSLRRLDRPRVRCRFFHH